jgi:hypothetical protein
MLPPGYLAIQLPSTSWFLGISARDRRRLPPAATQLPEHTTAVSLNYYSDFQRWDPIPGDGYCGYVSLYIISCFHSARPFSTQWTYSEIQQKVHTWLATSFLRQQLKFFLTQLTQTLYPPLGYDTHPRSRHHLPTYNQPPYHSWESAPFSWCPIDLIHVSLPLIDPNANLWLHSGPPLNSPLWLMTHTRRHWPTTLSSVDPIYNDGHFSLHLTNIPSKTLLLGYLDEVSRSLGSRSRKAKKVASNGTTKSWENRVGRNQFGHKSSRSLETKAFTPGNLHQKFLGSLEGRRIEARIGRTRNNNLWRG